MCCGVVPILFGWFLRVPSLHALVFIRKTFLDLYYTIREPSMFVYFRSHSVIVTLL